MKIIEIKRKEANLVVGGCFSEHATAEQIKKATDAANLSYMECIKKNGENNCYPTSIVTISAKEARERLTNAKVSSLDNGQ